MILSIKPCVSCAFSGGHGVKIFGALFLFLSLLSGISGAAAATYDLDPAGFPPGALPVSIDSGSSPVYITNTDSAGTDTSATATVDTLRVGERASLNIGFDADRVAGAPVGLGVRGNMSVAGQVRVGTAGERGGWLPGARTGFASGLDVGGALSVGQGGLVVIEGGSDDVAGVIEHSGVSAGRIDADGGEIRVHGAGELESASRMTIRNGGRVLVDAGLPPRDVDEMTDGDWIFKGVRAGGDGIIVDDGGVLASGAAGGVVDSSAVAVRRGGVLDVSDGDMLVRGAGEVRIDGVYRAGTNSQLTSESGGIVFGAGAKTTFTADLARRYNAGNGAGAAGTSAVLARGRAVQFTGGAPEVRSGMGFYTLGVVPFASPDGAVVARSGEALVISGVSRAVTGGGDVADRDQFHRNVDDIWDAPVEASQSAVMYDLLAARYPGIEASGEAGEFNRDNLENVMNGPDAGMADKGVFEMYSGGAQWGVNSVAFGTSELFMAGLDRRVHRIGAELDRLGHEETVEYASAGANPSLLLGLASGFDRFAYRDGTGRIWSGALYADDDAELDYGVSGYSYRPRGVMLGYDKSIASSYGVWTLGAAGAYAAGDYEDKAAAANDSSIDSYSAGLFAAYHGDAGFNASAFATLSGLDNSLSDLRGGMRREADFSSYSWSAGARLGYDMLLSDRAVIQPSVGLTHVSATSGSHNENLNGVQVMRVGDVTRDGTILPVDVTVGYDLLRSFDSILRLNVGLGYAYDFGGAPEGSLQYDGLVGAPAVDMTKRDGGGHRLNLGLGLLYTSERVDFTARYDYVQRDARAVHAGSTAFGLKF